jgi:hypothetical protein
MDVGELSSKLKELLKDKRYTTIDYHTFLRPNFELCLSTYSLTPSICNMSN